MPTIKRNAPCPCGSGHKYKKCHGAPATEEQKKRFAQLQAAFHSLPAFEFKPASDRRPKNAFRRLADRIVKGWKRVTGGANA